MTDDLADFWVHPTAVERYTGPGETGKVYAAATDETGFVDDSTKLVMNAQGQQVVSSARVYYPAATPAIPVESRVTLSGPFAGRVTQVILVSRHDSGDLDLPDHVEVALQ